MHSLVNTDNPVLHKKTKDLSPAEINSPATKTLIADMKKILASEDLGVALAAPQVGEPISLFIVSGKIYAEAASGDKKTPLSDRVFINPKIIRSSKKKIKKHEGCLSIKGKWGMVERAERASIRALDENGREFSYNASGLLAHIFQHEMDHLNGILYSEKATDLYDDADESHEE